MRRSLAGPVALALLAVVVAWGVWLRLEDPLSTEAIGAEDPYSHVVFTKESLEKGSFGDSFYLGTAMYPPGLHAFLGVLVSLSGVDFHELARFIPAAFGGLAIVGMYVLGARLANPSAGLAAATVTAVMPEHIFRTNLLFPTALDLALLPAFLLAFIYAWEYARRPRVNGRAQAWSVALLFLTLAIPMAFMHPWVVPLFLGPAAAFAALRSFRESLDARSAARSLLLPAGLAVAAIAFAMSFRWTESDTGFADFFAAIPGLSWLGVLDIPRPLLFLILVVVLGAFAAGAVALGGLAAGLRRRVPLTGRVLVAVGVAAGLLALLPLMTGNLPQDVSYHHMLGKAAIWLALGGLVVACVRPTPLGDMALAISVLLFPLTAINFFDSPFWPQRTVAYLSIGVALLAGALAGALHDAFVHHVGWRREHRLLAPAAVAVSFALLAGVVAANPAPTYDWYRLYNDEQFNAFRDTVSILEDDPSAKVVVRGWQAGLMIKALGDPEQVWYAPDYYTKDSKRDKVHESVHGTVYVLVDKYALREEQKGKIDLGFLAGKKIVHQTPDGQYRLYLAEEADE